MAYDNDKAFQELDILRAKAHNKAMKSKKFRALFAESMANRTKDNNLGESRVSIGSGDSVFYGFLKKNGHGSKEYEVKRAEIATWNEGLVYYFVKRTTIRESSEYDRDDLVQEGMLGLLWAIDMFDTSSGFKFSTYAISWIRHKIFRHMESNVSALSVPVYYVRECWDSGIDVPKSHEAPSCIKDEEMADFFENRTESPRCGLDIIEQGEVVSKAMKILSKVERQVVSHRFGLAGLSPKRLKEVGAIVNLSQERVRQIEDMALNKLKALGKDVFGIGDER